MIERGGDGEEGLRTDWVRVGLTWVGSGLGLLASAWAGHAPRSHVLAGLSIYWIRSPGGWVGLERLTDCGGWPKEV